MIIKIDEDNFLPSTATLHGDALLESLFVKRASNIALSSARESRYSTTSFDAAPSTPLVRQSMPTSYKSADVKATPSALLSSLSSRPTTPQRASNTTLPPSLPRKSSSRSASSSPLKADVKGVDASAFKNKRIASSAEVVSPTRSGGVGGGGMARSTLGTAERS